MQLAEHGLPDEPNSSDPNLLLNESGLPEPPDDGSVNTAGSPRLFSREASFEAPCLPPVSPPSFSLISLPELRELLPGRLGLQTMWRQRGVDERHSSWVTHHLPKSSGTPGFAAAAPAAAVANEDKSTTHNSGTVAVYGGTVRASQILSLTTPAQGMYSRTSAGLPVRAVSFASLPNGLREEANAGKLCCAGMRPAAQSLAGADSDEGAIVALAGAEVRLLFPLCRNAAAPRHCDPPWLHSRARPRPSPRPAAR